MSSPDITSPHDNEIERAIRERCVAITGGIATGKSTVAALLRKEGYTVIDADTLARAVTSPGHPCLKEITNTFGPGILTADGQLLRDKLRDIVFQNPAQKKRLEDITHPAIQAELSKKVAQLNPMPTLFFYEASLIFEAGRDHLFKEVWVTVCPKKTQTSRLMARSGLSETSAQSIIAAQMPPEEKARRATHVIDTSGSLDDVALKVKELLRQESV